jgi:hypothetical protein
MNQNLKKQVLFGKKILKFILGIGLLSCLVVIFYAKKTPQLILSKFDKSITSNQLLTQPKFYEISIKNLKNQVALNPKNIQLLTNSSEINKNSSNNNLELLKIAPDFFYIENIDREFVGKAIKLSENLYFTPDHIFAKYKKLFYNGEQIKVELRDFSRDLLFFSLKKIPRDIKKINLISNLPALETKVFWENKQLNQAKLIGFNENFTVGDQQKKCLLKITGIANYGDSGSPVFTKNGEVLGILIGSNRVSNISYLISSQEIKKILLSQYPNIKANY